MKRDERIILVLLTIVGGLLLGAGIYLIVTENARREQEARLFDVPQQVTPAQLLR